MDPERAEGIDISRHYDGAWHTRKGRSYRNPLSQDVGRERPIHVEDGFYHRDYLLRVTQMSQDLARYISPSYAKPFHLIVQATSRAFQEPQGEWRRAHLRGHAPTVVRLSVWAVGDLSDTRPKSNDEIALMWLKVLLILPAEIPLVLRGPLSKIPVLGSLLQPFLSSRGRMSDAYPIFFSRSWDYPKYPRNILDASPNHNRHHFNRQFATPPPAGIANDRVARQQAPARERVQENTQLGVPYDRSGDLERLIKPRKLMIQQSNREWRLSAGTSDSYIVISYASAHFPIDPHTGTCPRIERVAEQMAARSKCKAYWVAYRCMASPDDVKELTKDVHRMCDVFRGARQVYVLIPEITLENKRFWGTRMWCLPEARKSFYSVAQRV